MPDISLDDGTEFVEDGRLAFSLKEAVVMGLLDDLKLTWEELEELLQQNPSMRGLFVGYLAERRLGDIWFPDQPLKKYDNHDRKKKGDRWITYKGHEISIEVKSLQSNYVEKTETGWEGRFQCDACDCRAVKLPNGDRLRTTCLVVGEFDLLAINPFVVMDKIIESKSH